MPGNSWWERPLALGLLPFGDEGNDAGPLCFDTRASNDPDSWPITFWDHDGPEEIGPTLFSSFDALLRGCTAYMRCAAEARRRASDPQDRLASDADCLRSLMAADPQGAGSGGAGYWSRLTAPPDSQRPRVSAMTIAGVLLVLLCAIMIFILLRHG